ncbi:MAG: HAMP domain-containing sensor histidine kinase [candidate division Zixibacteria bacterium]|jgi:signal transduction histidine kinase|nr:HAMP domain-containing sensor histidine kinase [candidate division Zixibacteria bacterium]
MAPRWRAFNRTSDLYVGKSTLFKTFLLVGIAIISIGFIWYTFDVIDTLQRDIRSQVEKYVQLWQLAANSPMSGSELQFIFNEIIVKATFPILVVDQDGEPLYWRNIKDIDPELRNPDAPTMARLKKIAADMKKQNGEFKLHYGDDFVHHLYYGDSEVINELKLMPFVEIGIVLAFLIVGMIGFQTIRRSEERHIWVGMAKETAHQLGTPISSLMGWIEVLESESPVRDGAEPGLIDQTVDNMKIDVRRLQRVANRFGQIGSIPELSPCKLNELIEEVVEYYRRRLPFEGHGVQITFHGGDIPEVDLNPELLTWALENLVKNALQAVDSKTGVIEITSTHGSDPRMVDIEMKDNGPGISPAAARKIFRPGFTTKKRGWGLGLTLVKRIVEEYHDGQIRLERSHPGETVFKITLPVAARR